MYFISSSNLFLRLRNLLHSVAPGFSDMVESARKAEKYRRVIVKSGFVLPLPPFMKRSILLRFALDNGCSTFVETGTQYGDTPWLLRDRFQSIYTIELSARLAGIARDRFRKYPHIQVVEGDSGEKLASLLPTLKSKTLFWLDGHYSAGVTAQGELDCPIYAELQSIFDKCPVPFVVLIDDARCFGTEKDYPTIRELKDFIAKKTTSAEVAVTNDIISIVVLDSPNVITH